MTDRETLRARVVGALLQQAQDFGHTFPPGVESYAQAVVDNLRPPGRRMCPECRDWLDDEDYPPGAEVCVMCAKGRPGEEQP